MVFKGYQDKQSTSDNLSSCGLPPGGRSCLFSWDQSSSAPSPPQPPWATGSHEQKTVNVLSPRSIRCPMEMSRHEHSMCFLLPSRELPELSVTIRSFVISRTRVKISSCGLFCFWKHLFYTFMCPRNQLRKLTDGRIWCIMNVVARILDVTVSFLHNREIKFSRLSKVTSLQ